MARTLGILVGGGPAPGINGVIGAATIRAINAGMRVIGVFDGYAGLMGRCELQTTPLRIVDVSRIHFLGGSILRTDRANPIKAGTLDVVTAKLHELEVTHLLTIGGDDTATVAGRIAAESDVRVIHAPKTIDNDLPLPPGVPTFGFSTARQLGGALLKNLMGDAYVAKRWFLVETMGRKAGHLALGIGKSAGVPLILVPEAFAPNTDVTLVVDLIVGSILKRLADRRPDGVVLYTEGLPDKLDPVLVESLIGEIPRDTHGHPRWSEVDFATALKRLVTNRLDELGVAKFPITNERVGYTLRCSDPNPFDLELTRDLGTAAVEQLLAGQSDCMVSIQGERVVCIPFTDLIDPATGRSCVRLVDVEAQPWQSARNLMIRLQDEDLEADRLARIAAVTNLGPDRFRDQFARVTRII